MARKPGSRGSRWLGLGALLLLALAVLWFWQERRATIHYVVPDGYRGIFRLELEPAAPALTREGGRYLVVIPDAGILRVRRWGPLLDLREHTAAYAGGRPLSVGIADRGELSPGRAGDEVKLYALETDASGRSYYLVGTAVEMVAAQDLRERPLGGVGQVRGREAANLGRREGSAPVGSSSSRWPGSQTSATPPLLRGGRGR